MSPAPDRYLVISADTHAGLPGPEYREWLDPGYRETFDSFMAEQGIDTTPLIFIDGERIGDSTAIIAALERRFPSPPLYPSDPVERQRALELEDFFDEEFAPRLSMSSTIDPTSGEFSASRNDSRKVRRLPPPPKNSDRKRA